ncbi:uncharacterized protein LOC141734339 [Larus michahellis]|uniref:uncharacterized protein LOC141734339 n=1 Tax=Larus michahellis TaxID=119627 RepID=UPI003D9ACAF6
MGRNWSGSSRESASAPAPSRPGLEELSWDRFKGKPKAPLPQQRDLPLRALERFAGAVCGAGSMGPPLSPAAEHVASSSSCLALARVCRHSSSLPAQLVSAWLGAEDEEVVTRSHGHGQKDHQPPRCGGTGMAAVGRTTPNLSSPAVPGAAIRAVTSPTAIALGTAALASAQPSASLPLPRPRDARSHRHHTATPAASDPLALPSFQLLHDSGTHYLLLDHISAGITPIPGAPGDQQYTVTLPLCLSLLTAPVRIPEVSEQHRSDEENCDRLILMNNSSLPADTVLYVTHWSHHLLPSALRIPLPGAGQDREGDCRCPAAGHGSSTSVCHGVCVACTHIACAKAKANRTPEPRR